MPSIVNVVAAGVVVVGGVSPNMVSGVLMLGGGC